MVEKTRIPAGESAQFASWSLPDVESGQVIESGVSQVGREPGDRVVARTLTARQLDEITSQAHREGFAHGAKEGRLAGHAQGLNEGRAVARTELAKEVAELRAVMQQLLDPITAQNTEIEAALARLSLDIARAVLQCEPAIPAEDLIPLVRRAVRELPVGERNITVMLNPRQLERVREHAEWPSGWKLQADARLDVGGCKITTEHSLVDYSIELRFRQIAAQMLAEAGAEAIEPGKMLGDDDD